MTPSAGPGAVLVFAGLLVAPGVDGDALEAELRGLFGEIAGRGPRFPFTDTDYYEREMGPGLVRSWLAFDPPRPDGCLPALKGAAVALESRLAGGRGRRVNVDPGTLDDLRVVLASTKGNGHRVYLGEGIWGDLHCLLEGGGFAPLPWTYPDYRRPEVLDWFSSLRRSHLPLLGRAGAAPRGRSRA